MEGQKREEKTEMSDQSVQKKMAKSFSFAGVQINGLHSGLRHAIGGMPHNGQALPTWQCITQYSGRPNPCAA